MRKLDLTGRTFGRLAVLQEATRRNDHHVRFECLCACGNKSIVDSSNLTSGHTQSCGCFGYEQNISDFTGMKINNWKIIERTSKRYKGGDIAWKCECLGCNEIYIRNPHTLKFQCQKCYLNSGISKCANSLLIKIEQYLQYKIEREYQIKDKFFDGYIPELNLLIESDGKYWHSTKKAKEIDNIKNTLAREVGLNLFRVTNDSELEVETAFEKFKDWYHSQEDKKDLRGFPRNLSR